jgi:hypothetical protein
MLKGRTLKISNVWLVVISRLSNGWYFLFYFTVRRLSLYLNFCNKPTVGIYGLHSRAFGWPNFYLIFMLTHLLDKKIHSLPSQPANSMSCQIKTLCAFDTLLDVVSAYRHELESTRTFIKNKIILSSYSTTIACIFDYF